LCSRGFSTAVVIMPIPYEVCRFVRAYRCRLLAKEAWRRRLAERVGDQELLFLRVSVSNEEVYSGVFVPETFG
jgi:hypothetical protein